MNRKEDNYWFSIQACLCMVSCSCYQTLLDAVVVQMTPFFCMCWWFSNWQVILSIWLSKTDCLVFNVSQHQHFWKMAWAFASWGNLRATTRENSSHLTATESSKGIRAKPGTRTSYGCEPKIPQKTSTRKAIVVKVRSEPKAWDVKPDALWFIRSNHVSP